MYHHERTSIPNNRVVAALVVISCVLLLSPSAQADKKDWVPQKAPLVKGGNGGPNGGACATVPGNIVANCGFESGDFLPGWVQSGDPAFTGVSTVPDGIGFPNSGNYAAFFGPIGDLGCISQSLVTPAFSYDFGAYFSTRGVPNELQIYWDGNLVFDAVNLDEIPAWAFGSLSALPTPGNPTELKLCFRNDPDWINLDDVVVTETPASPKQ